MKESVDVSQLEKTRVIEDSKTKMTIETHASIH